jgi:hypothetical protein
MRRQHEDPSQPANPASVEGPESLSRKELLASKRSIPLFAYVILIAAVGCHTQLVLVWQAAATQTTVHYCSTVEQLHANTCLIGLQIFAVSSAGVVFKKLESDVQPITAAAWRLQATSIVLLPMFIAQWRDTNDHIRQEWWKAWPLMSASGLALAVHFSTWVFGLARTSLPHALLFVTSTPILIAAGCLILRLPITRGEVASAAAGFLGMVLCEIATSADKVRSSKGILNVMCSMHTL